MKDLDDAWVPGKAGEVPAREPELAVAVRRLGEALESAGAGNQSVSDLLLAEARWLLGDSAAKTIYAMQVGGQLPEVGTPGWRKLVQQVADGTVVIRTTVEAA